ncbi:hypothetical protein Aduo_017208 [Ancylostoma duodenale]
MTSAMTATRQAALYDRRRLVTAVLMSFNGPSDRSRLIVMTARVIGIISAKTTTTKRSEATHRLFCARECFHCPTLTLALKNIRAPKPIFI